MTTRFLDILYSAGFLRQVSNVALLFAALNLIAGVIAVVFAAGNVESIATGIGLIVVGSVLCVMALLLRRGWRSVFWILVALFGVDFLALIFVPPGRSFGGALVARVFLIVALVNDFQRRRRAVRGAVPQAKHGDESV